MSDLSGLTTNFFPTPKEGFTTTTSGTVDSSTDTTIGFNSVSGLNNGDIFTGLIDPGNAKERAFTGVVDTGGSQITNVVFTTGSNATHTAGATVVDYVTSTHVAQITKGLTTTVFDQDGTLKAGAVDNAAVLASNVVTTAKILDANVTTAKIADNAVTMAKRGKIFVVKSATEDVTSSTTLQDDNDLLFAIGASETWAFELLLTFDSGATADFKCDFSLPAGATGKVIYMSPGDTTGQLVYGGSDPTTDVTIPGNGFGTEVVLLIKGVIVNSTNAGNVTFRWAQASSNASATSVYAGSYIIATKVV